MLGFFSVVIVGLYVFTDWIISGLRPRYLEAVEENLVDTASVLSTVLAEDARAGAIGLENFERTFSKVLNRRFRARIYHLKKEKVDLRVYVTDPKGIVIYDSHDGETVGRDYSEWNDVLRTLRGEYGARTTRTDPDDARTAVLHVASPVVADGRLLGVLTVAKPVDSVNVFVRTAARKIVIGVVLLALGMFFLGAMISEWVTRPISQLIAYAHAVRRGERCKLPDLGAGEIGRLGQAFEEMREALEGKKYVETYVQTLTHEMKSPLAAIRGAAELLTEDMPDDRRGRFIENIRIESARIQMIVDRLLELASLENRQTLREEIVIDLAELVAEVRNSFRPAIEKKALSFTVTVSAGATLVGEKFLVRQALVNVVQNAVDFSEPGGAISIAVEREGEWIVIGVGDNGPGIPEFALDKIFDRFFSLQRPATGKKSSGLGLSFVREAVGLHRGAATVRNRDTGGTEVRLKFPVKS